MQLYGSFQIFILNNKKLTGRVPLNNGPSIVDSYCRPFTVYRLFSTFICQLCIFISLLLTLYWQFFIVDFLLLTLYYRLLLSTFIFDSLLSTHIVDSLSSTLIIDLLL